MNVTFFSRPMCSYSSASRAALLTMLARHPMPATMADWVLVFEGQ